MRRGVTLRRATWGVATVVFAAIALVAVSRTVTAYLVPLLRHAPAPYGWDGLLLALGWFLVATLLLVLAWRGANHPRARGAVLPLVIVLGAVAIRLAVAALLDGAIYGETRIVRDQALGVLAGDCCFSHRPMGYPIVLAGAFRLLGVTPAAIELLNVALAAATAWLTWDIGRIAWSRRVGALAATAYAVMPSQALFALVPLTEPMFALVVALIVRLAIAPPGRVLLATAGAGAAIALGQYVRATAAALLLPVVLLPFLGGHRLGAAAARAAAVLAVFLVLMAPVIGYNLRAHQALSVSTSAYGGWSLYVGANRQSGGQWNAADAARLASFPGDDWWQRSEYAGSLAFDRIMEDPAGSARLLTRKFWTMWADETYAASYALGGSAVTQGVQVGWLGSQLLWAPLVLLAAIGMARERRHPRPAALLIGMSVTLTALVHLALEVHSRYHSYLVPLLCVLAAAGASSAVRWWAARRAGRVAAEGTAPGA